MAASGQGAGTGIQEKIEQQESLINNIGLRYEVKFSSDKEVGN